MIWAGVLLKHWRAVLLALLVGLLGVQTLRLDHAKADLGAAREAAAAWKQNRDLWRDYGVAEQKAFAQEHAYRLGEHARATADLTAARRDCAERVARARKSAVAIRGIITKEPRYDAANCPVRELVPADLLREAIAPAGG